MAKEKIQPVRGMQDILPDEMRKHDKITDTARKVAQLYGFEHMATPIMESVEVFKRSLGDSSDVVNKEMYTLKDRKDRELVLRPENTASIARAIISNGLQQTLPAKFFYNGPMFRYERPQKGRQRQFHQIGIELLGESTPLADIDVITCGYQILRGLGLTSQVKLQINTLGDSESREKYKEALVNYLTEYEEELSEDSQVRLKKNPLRILDSKDEHDKRILVDAPKLNNYLNQESNTWLDTLSLALQISGVPYEKNPYLVRGLDYYCHTVFEFVTDNLGAQNAVLAGGRYDGLVNTLGGNNVAGVGWAAGVERIALMLNEVRKNSPEISLISAHGDTALFASLAHFIRSHDIYTDYLYSGNLKKGIYHAGDSNAKFALIIMENGKFTLRKMAARKEYNLFPPYKMPEGIEKEDENLILRLIKALKEFYKL